MDQEKEDALHELNAIKQQQLAPVTVYILVLMITGSIGNAMVCYFYGCKTRRTSNTVFILTLAVYDLLTCWINMPTELVDIQYFYTFRNSTVCKVLCFLNYYTAIGSGMTLLVIAYDRYRLICKSRGPQLTARDVQATCLFVGALAVLLSWPVLILYGSVPLNLVSKGNFSVTGYDCTFQTNHIHNLLNMAYNGVHLFLFTCSTCVLLTLYIIIGKKIYQHKKQCTNISRREMETVKYTMIMITVTAVFILSFLPYLCLTLWATFVGKPVAGSLSDNGIIAYKMGTNSYLINSVANPFIYGLFNPSFRYFIFRRCMCYRRSSNSPEISRTHTELQEASI